MDDEYIPIRELCKIIKFKYRSAKKFAKESNIKFITTPSGQTLYSKKSIHKYINDNVNIPIAPEKIQKYNIVYCRVSSTKQENDLQRQVELARQLYPNHTIISDVASGINWKRKGLKTILEYAMSGVLESVTIFHRDRLARFAYELIEFIIKSNGAKLYVINEDKEKSYESELTEDLLSIIHIYSCRQMGKRRYSKKSIDIKVKKN